MKIFQTEPDVTSAISIIERAREYVVIVSPFSDMTGWDRLKDTINKASEKIPVRYYVRKGQGTKGIGGINVDLFEVPMLHAKMIFSEHEGMISSGNLDIRPDINCTVLLNKKEEYDSIVDFYNQYIKPVSIRIN